MLAFDSRNGVNLSRSDSDAQAVRESLVTFDLVADIRPILNIKLFLLDGEKGTYASYKSLIHIILEDQACKHKILFVLQTNCLMPEVWINVV